MSAPAFIILKQHLIAEENVNVSAISKSPNKIYYTCVNGLLWDNTLKKTS